MVKEKNEKFSKLKFARTVRVPIVDIDMVRGSPRNLLSVHRLTGLQVDCHVG